MKEFNILTHTDFPEEDFNKAVLTGGFSVFTQESLHKYVADIKSHGTLEDIEKAQKDLSKLTRVKVTDKNGHSVYRWVDKNPNQGKKEAPAKKETADNQVESFSDSDLIAEHKNAAIGGKYALALTKEIYSRAQAVLKKQANKKMTGWTGSVQTIAHAYEILEGKPTKESQISLLSKLRAEAASNNQQSLADTYSKRIEKLNSNIEETKKETPTQPAAKEGKFDSTNKEHLQVVQNTFGKAFPKLDIKILKNGFTSYLPSTNKAVFNFDAAKITSDGKVKGNLYFNAIKGEDKAKDMINNKDFDIKTHKGVLSYITQIDSVEAISMLKYGGLMDKMVANVSGGAAPKPKSEPKPKPKEKPKAKKSVPFTIDDVRQKMIGQVIKEKNSSMVNTISSVEEDDMTDNYYIKLFDESAVSLESLFNNYVDLDGNPLNPNK